MNSTAFQMNTVTRPITRIEPNIQLDELHPLLGTGNKERIYRDVLDCKEKFTAEQFSDNAILALEPFFKYKSEMQDDFSKSKNASINLIKGSSATLARLAKFRSINTNRLTNAKKRVFTELEGEYRKSLQLLKIEIGKFKDVNASEIDPFWTPLISQIQGLTEFECLCKMKELLEEYNNAVKFLNLAKSKVFQLQSTILTQCD